jgi:surface protein
MLCDAFFAVFDGAFKFNSDLSKWETGNVTTMYYSKCTLLGVVFFFSNKKNLRKIQKYESDPPTTNGVCSLFSSCVDRFPLFQFFRTWGSVDRCVVVHGKLCKVNGQEVILVTIPPVLLDTVAARPVRSCPTQMPIPSQQQLPVPFVRRINREPIPITTRYLAVVQFLSLPARAPLVLPLCARL